ncbi:hypothetical protein NliqN6_6778 [Naganishia liquefaciens]|uniref:Uncharacterized protein n=1 Tax=Naganishia liquefaciens TaxID=104408 RepID=A0A8H3TZ75_9TREE|nr:hypothetical protein NliqN6_6778 [Naganishia liquefaciens]
MSTKKLEPAAIPRILSDVEEEQRLARDNSFGPFRMQEDGFVTAKRTNNRAMTLNTRTLRHASSGQKQVSSFDQLRLYHPFSDESWRSCGLQLEHAQPIRDEEDLSSKSSESKQVGITDRVITQSWKSSAEESLTSSSSSERSSEREERHLDDRSLQSQSVSISDTTDPASHNASSDQVFPVEYPRSKARCHAQSSLHPESESEHDSLTAYGVTAPGSFSFNPSYESSDGVGKQKLPFRTFVESPIIETTSSAATLSTPLTQYAAGRLIAQATDGSSTLHDTRSVMGHAKKSAARTGTYRLEQSSSTIGDSSTPLTAYQVTQKTASLKLSLSPEMASSTPLSNYAADRMPLCAATERRYGFSGLVASRRISAFEDFRWSPDEESVEHPRLPPKAHVEDSRLANAAELASAGELSSSFSKCVPLQVSLSEGGTQVRSPQLLSLPNRLVGWTGDRDDPPESTILTALQPVHSHSSRCRGKSAAKELKDDSEHADGTNNFLRPWGLSENWQKINEFELSVEYVV